MRDFPTWEWQTENIRAGDGTVFCDIHIKIKAKPTQAGSAIFLSIPLKDFLKHGLTVHGKGFVSYP